MGTLLGLMTNLVTISVLTDALNEHPLLHICPKSISQTIPGRDYLSSLRFSEIFYFFLRVNYSQAIAVIVMAYQLEYTPVRVHEAGI